MDTFHIRESARGFTLIEVAVVVAVIAALMTLGLGFLNAQLASSAQSITKKKQEAIKEALIAFLGTHKRLPCPDVPNNTNGAVDLISGVNGKEDIAGGACVFPFGIVPYATLGLSRETATDGWSNFLSYRVFQGIPTGAPADPAPPPPLPPTPCGADWTQKDCFGAGKNGGLQVRDSTVNQPLTEHAIAVVISHGPNGLAAWVGATKNVQLPVKPETCEERRNANIGTPDCTTPPLPLNTYFRGERENLDDIVSWLDATEAINALSRQGIVKIAVAQVNEDLQLLYDQVLGMKYQNVSADPKPPNQCSQPLSFPLSGRSDPWGNLYAIDDSSPPGGPGFPICIFSTGGSGSPPSRNTDSCTCTLPTICRNLDKLAFNSYLAKVPLPLCP